MFGIGTGELLLLLVIALLVLGPERMPKLARDLGKTVGDLRRTSDELRTEFLNADKTLNAEKMLEVAARTAEKGEAAKAPEAGATQADVVPTKADVVPSPSEPPPIPAEPEETAFDREVRLARERIDKSTGV